ncbi:MAG: hypothetical protein R3231_11910, partial [bacterium]|nr:hypothetical protein [bacterium]
MVEKGKAGFGIDPKDAGENALRFMKSSFDATFENMVKIQDLNEKMLKEMIDKGEAAQKDATKMVQDFMAQAKKERDKYRQAMEDGFKN